MAQRMELRRLTLLGLVAIVCGLVGCSAFKEQLSPKLQSEVTPGAGPVAPPPAKFTVEIRPENAKPQAIERDLTDQLHVQAALEQTGVSKKWARMNIELYRPLPSGGWHKMSLEFDREHHQVPPEYDYALLPGDRVVVTQDTSNLLDDVMQRTLAPLGIAPRTKKSKVSDKYQIRG